MFDLFEITLNFPYIFRAVIGVTEQCEAPEIVGLGAELGDGVSGGTGCR